MTLINSFYWRNYANTEYKISIYKIAANKFMIALQDNDDSCMDEYMAGFFKMTLTEYKLGLVRAANGYVDKKCQEIFFRTIEDAQQGIDWIESMILMRQLTESSEQGTTERWKV